MSDLAGRGSLKWALLAACAVLLGSVLLSK
jgi:hypothetical protein